VVTLSLACGIVLARPHRFVRRWLVDKAIMSLMDIVLLSLPVAGLRDRRNPRPGLSNAMVCRGDLVPPFQLRVRLALPVRDVAARGGTADARQVAGTLVARPHVEAIG